MVADVKWYLAGPMSGIEEQNYPAFKLAAEQLRTMGYYIVSPHETFPYPIQPDEARWQMCLGRDIATLSACEGIILLPGWSKSKGVRLELHVALALGLQIRLFNTGRLLDIS